jgi:HEAT repeat protein
MPVFAKFIKKLTSIFAEKTQIKPDDFELEHFLLYHGLVGTSPENQRKFKDVRADIRMAVENQSSQQLASTLKLSPLWWEEKLKAIFAEIDDRNASVATLAPDVEDDALTFEHIPLLNSDWQSRACAALALAQLNAIEANDKLIHSLHDTAGSARTAFCHIANALGRLGQPASETALAQYLAHEEPWIRVDAVSALAELTKDPKTIINALLERHPMSDYAAIAVAKVIEPRQFFESDDAVSIAAGCQIVQDVLNASTQTFTDDIIVDTGIPQCMPALASLLVKPSCTIALTAIRLAEWLDSHHSYTLLDPPSQDDLKKALTFGKSAECRTLVQKQLEGIDSDSVNDPLKLSDLRCAIILCGKLEDRDSIKFLVSALKADHPLLDDSIKTLTELRATEASESLVQLANKLVDIEDRKLRPRQLHPVHEANKSESKTYWLILKALGNMPTQKSVDFLLQAAEDYAPDIRSQALISLIDATETMKNGEIKPELKGRLSDALSDPSPDVRKAALRGVAIFETVGDLKKVVGLTRAPEVSTQREAYETLSELAKKGHKKDVIETLSQALKTEPDAHKRQKLRDFIDTTDRQTPVNRLEP